MKLIKGGTVVTSQAEFQADVLIEGEKIKAVGAGLDAGGCQVIDAAGRYVFAGGVDQHTHFGSFGGMDFETTEAAAVGGTTTVVDFAPQARGEGLLEAVEKHGTRAQGRACVDYGFHSMVMDLTEGIYDELKYLPKHGVSCLKMFMAYRGTPFYMHDEAILRAMDEARLHGLTMMVHAENADMIALFTEKLKAQGRMEPKYHCQARPPIAENEAVRRAIALAESVAAPLYVVHLTTREAMEAVREAYNRGQSVYGETCTHYLVMDESYLARGNFEGAKYVCSPPLRPVRHQEALWQAAERGWLNAVSSDHCAVRGGFQRKKEGMGDFSRIPNGMPGVQSRMSVLWSEGVARGRITRRRFAALTSEMPARNVGLQEKGQVAPGFDADLVIYDPDYRGSITLADSREGIDYAAYEGFPMIGRPEKVFLRGTLVAENGRFVGERGCGKRVFAKPYGLAFDGIKRR